MQKDSSLMRDDWKTSGDVVNESNVLYTFLYCRSPSFVSFTSLYLLCASVTFLLQSMQGVFSTQAIIFAVSAVVN